MLEQRERIEAIIPEHSWREIVASFTIGSGIGKKPASANMIAESDEETNEEGLERGLSLSRGHRIRDFLTRFVINHLTASAPQFGEQQGVYHHQGNPGNTQTELVKQYQLVTGGLLDSGLFGIRSSTRQSYRSAGDRWLTSQ